MDKIKVLYVDDENNNLAVFRSSFRRVFDVYLANTVEQAREILEKHQIEVVIADQRMPGMTGVQFFESILDLYPTPIRILLTGYSDIKALEDAINKGQVYRFINKPWNEFELKLTIENAYHIYQLRDQNNKLTNKYKKIFEDSSDSIILFDTKGRIIDFNKATIDLFETIQLQFNLTYFSDYFTTKDEIDFIAETICTKGYIHNYECKITLKRGLRKICLISANKVCNSYGEIVSYQAVIRDITKRTRTHQLLLRTTIRTQDEERARISRDLHDGLGQTLTGIKFYIEDLKDKVDHDVVGQVHHISDVLKSTISQLRTICYDLLPPSISNYGIQKALEILCQTFSSDVINITAIFGTEIELSDKELEITIYRIVQEFINNSIKYSGCDKIIISIENIDGQITLNLRDNGHGFDLKSNDKGLGLNNIITRVKSFNGNINLISNKKDGTFFKITIPVIEEKNHLQNIS